MNTVTPINLHSAQNSSISSATAHFDEHFKLVVANTPKLQAEVYKLRYKVYCQELGYEREEDCPNGMEQDIYDQHSIHCLLLHRKSGVYAGCVRLVLPKPNHSGTNLPFERVFGQGLQSSLKELKHLSYDAVGEVSRLAVTAEFRKRIGETETTHGVATEQYEAKENERRYFPLIALGLYLAATGVAMELGLDSALTLMEPRLARHLRRFGIRFRQVGELVEFHGQRGLFQISQDAALDDMDADTYELLQRLRSQIKQSLRHYPVKLSDCQAA
ncbi:MAG: PEP-CTERM/exosortase system-associated acyltransferase [Chroococcidiopsidaceae cyanobacterium CP_BM_ER_R8_30]|nr:PEP-CTERM/exosortase system-associated acyltransferase [Chroococcidiopsidaceae cyanobacterium CP_BM_ER_R8_30]